MRHSGFLALAALLVAQDLAAIEPLSDRVPSLTLGPEILDEKAAGIGKVIMDVRLEQVDGAVRGLHELGGSRGTIVIVRDPKCPVSRRYGPRVAKLSRAYHGRGFTFIFVYLNERLPIAEMQIDRQNFETIGVFVTRGGFALADQLGVESTGDVFLLDAKMRLRFRGAVDDQYGLGYTKSAPTNRYLRNAIDAVLQGRPIAVPATTAPGCYIDADPQKDEQFRIWPADGALS
jgi:hypothetical protein